MPTNERTETRSSEVNLLDYLYVAARGWKLILLNFVVVCGVAAIVSLFLPKWYSGATTLLPPREASGGLFAEMLKNIPVLRLGQRATPADIIKAMLKSKRILKSTVKAYNLVEVYNIKTKGDNPDKALALATETLDDRSKVTITPEGLIRLEVLDRDRIRCAQIANAFVDTLIALKRELDAEDDARTALFIGTSLIDSSRARLAEAQGNLQRFLEEHGVASVPDQAQAVIQAAATLELELISLQMNLEYLKTSLGETHPQVKEMETKIRLRKRQLEHMEEGTWPGDTKSLFLPLRSVPQMVLQQEQLRAQVSIWTDVLAYLLGKKAEAEFRRDNPSSGIQVLDKAVPPVRRAKPKRQIIVVIAGTVSLLISLFGVIAVQSFNSLRESGDRNARRIEEILSLFRRSPREP